MTSLLSRQRFLLLTLRSRSLGLSEFRRNFKENRGTGDTGQSSLFTNEKLWKDDHVFEAVGTTDELSSHLGLCREKAKAHGLFDLETLLTKVQCCLQDLGSHLATPRTSDKERLKARTEFEPELVQEVDSLIDSYASSLPPLRQFILPGGGELSAQLNVARSVCRRAERCVASLRRAEKVDKNALKYLNRLSDLLFVLSRYSTHCTNSTEYYYMKPKEFTVGKIWRGKKL